jgi:hypothetical protein
MADFGKVGVLTVILIYLLAVAIYLLPGSILSSHSCSHSEENKQEGISGVSGRLWVPERKRDFSLPHVYASALDQAHPPVVFSGAELDAWFLPQASKPIKTTKAIPTSAQGHGSLKKIPHNHNHETVLSSSTCKSDKWVVLTTIFAPTKLIYQLESLSDWCTVVIADLKTPLQLWNTSTFQRVKLVTVQEQLALPFRILEFIPMNHFGRKNVGYLYAISAGAKYIYDTDDDNVLKVDANGQPNTIPIVSAQQLPHRVAQAWHCGFQSRDTRTWNPYALFGQSSAWPRGLPLNDIRWASYPCGHSSAASKSSAGQAANHTEYTYHKLFHQLPGITFAVQQSLADVNPDVDAIYRLTQHSPTFSFDSSGDEQGFYGPDHVYAPYNAQATLHQMDSFWGMLLPVTVHGRVSDIWRSYITQRLMWKYGMRVAFMKPWVDQERTAHNFLKDFDSEQPLYLRAPGLVDFLRSWRPSSDNLSLPAEYEELIVALYEIGVVELSDVLIAQAWLKDLEALGYQFPTNSMRIYDVWSQQKFLGGMSILADEHPDGEAIQALLRVLPAQMAMFSAQRYPVMIFHSQAGSKWLDAAMKLRLRSLAPALRLEFYSTQCTWPNGYSFSDQTCSSQFTAYEIYRHPAVWRLQYLFRVGGNLTSLIQTGRKLATDVFTDMSATSVKVLNLQQTTEGELVLGDMCNRVKHFSHEIQQEQLGSIAWKRWKREESTFCTTPRRLVGGQMEVYNLRETFLNPLYFQFLEAVDFLEGLYMFNWHEHAIRTMWLRAVTAQ